MKYISCLLVALSVFLMPSAVLAQAPASLTARPALGPGADRAPYDVQAATETLAAIAQLGRAIHTRQASAATSHHFFSDVPVSESVYANVAALQERGIAKGYPKGYFGGKRVLTRYEFGVAIQRVLASLSPSRGDGDGYSPLGLTREDLLLLSKLAEKFEDVLTALGMDMPMVRSRLNAALRPVGATTRP